MNASILVINQLNINNLLDQTGLPDQYSVSKKRHRRSRITTYHHQGFPTPTCNWLQHCQPQQYLRLSPSPLWCFQTSPLRCLDLSTPYSQSRKEMLYGDTGSLEGMLIRTPCGEGEGHPEEKATSSRAGHPTLSVATWTLWPQTVEREVALGYSSAQVTVSRQRLSCYRSVHVGRFYALRWEVHHISHGMLHYSESFSVSAIGWCAGACAQRAAFTGGLDHKLMTYSFNAGPRTATLFQFWSRQQLLSFLCLHQLDQELRPGIWKRTVDGCLTQCAAASNRSQVYHSLWASPLWPLTTFQMLIGTKWKPACQSSCKNEWTTVVTFFFGEGAYIKQPVHNLV